MLEITGLNVRYGAVEALRDVSVKVGKSESYVRQRLFLTNLSEKARKLYRKSDMSDSVAALVARLTPDNQDAMLKEVRYLQDVDDVKDYIELVQFGPPVVYNFCPAPVPGCPPVPIVQIPINSTSLAQY